MQTRLFFRRNKMKYKGIPWSLIIMAERKAVNKYIPANFDPSKIQKGGGGKHTVRLMAPFSMKCLACGEYIYKGKKFNARKEHAFGEDYLGITIYRFYIKCPLCASEITFKTDPKNAEYQAEHGATRNFEPWREERKKEEEGKAVRLLEEMVNPMKKLEHKSFDSKRELDLMEGLLEIQAAGESFEKISSSIKYDDDKLLSILNGRGEDNNDLHFGEGNENEILARKKIQQEEDRLVAEAFSHRNNIKSVSDSSFSHSPINAFSPLNSSISHNIKREEESFSSSKNDENKKINISDSTRTLFTTPIPPSQNLGIIIRKKKK